LRYPLLESEREADPEGEWISYGVRMKLDLVGRKISLDDWSRLPRSVRDELTELTAETDAEIAVFERALDSASSGAGIDSQSLPSAKREAVTAWRDPGEVTPAAQAFLGGLGGEGLWPELDRFGRYLICTFSHKSDIGRARRAMIQLGYLAA
jgi:hypothetical protein